MSPDLRTPSITMPFSFNSTLNSTRNRPRQPIFRLDHSLFLLSQVSSLPETSALCVEAVGKPSILNHFSEPIRDSPGKTRSPRHEREGASPFGLDHWVIFTCSNAPDLRESATVQARRFRSSLLAF
jgi:hypothetical protein